MTTTLPLAFTRRSAPEMFARAGSFLHGIRDRRSVRDFAPDRIPDGVLELCIEAATTAPSGANKQPWTFVIVRDPALKQRIRTEAEAEEQAFYGGRAGERWLRDLEPIGTGPDKPFLEIAPALIVVFAHRHGTDEGERNYYVSESVGIATGFLLAALHWAGLATLTHTPSPMGFLAEILERPANERPYLLIPVGYPADGCQVPDLPKKTLAQMLVQR